MRKFIVAAVGCAMSGIAGFTGAADVGVSAPPSNVPLKAGRHGAEASIPFANHGGILDWRVLNDRTVLVESQNRVWYKASLSAPCVDLPVAERIGFESNPDGSFDKFSAIQVKDQRCTLKSLVKTAAPPQDSKKPYPIAAPQS